MITSSRSPLEIGFDSAENEHSNVSYKGCILYDHAQIETRTQLKEDKPTATDRTPYSPAQVAKAIALLVTSVGQVYYLKSFFESKTSI